MVPSSVPYSPVRIGGGGGYLACQLRLSPSEVAPIRRRHESPYQDNAATANTSHHAMPRWNAKRAATTDRHIEPICFDPGANIRHLTICADPSSAISAGKHCRPTSRPNQQACAPLSSHDFRYPARCSGASGLFISTNPASSRCFTSRSAVIRAMNSSPVCVRLRPSNRRACARAVPISSGVAGRSAGLGCMAADASGGLRTKQERRIYKSLDAEMG